MINYWSSAILAVGINIFAINPIVPELENYNYWGNDSVIQGRDRAELDSRSQQQEKQEEVSYRQLMDSGYAALEEKDYIKALNDFRQAKEISPDGESVEQAIKEVTITGFNFYMNSGYTANNNRDYQLALDNFEKAIKIKPDSVYAKAAIDNVNSYIVRKNNPQITARKESLENIDEKTIDRGSKTREFVLTLLGLGATSVAFLALTFILFKQSKKEEETTLQDTNNENSSVEIEKVKEEDNMAIEPSSNSSNIITREEVDSSISTTETIDSNIIGSTPLVPMSSSISKIDIVPELIADLRNRDRNLRRKTIWELAQRGDSRAMKPLVELMIKVDSQERSLILEAMTQIASRTLKPMNQALMLSLADENAQVKQNAIRDLTRVYELMNQVTQRLSEVVNDSDETVRETAQWALGKLNRIPSRSWEIERSLAEGEEHLVSQKFLNEHHTNEKN